jgi:hypothetical protein
MHSSNSPDVVGSTRTRTPVAKNAKDIKDFDERSFAICEVQESNVATEAWSAY